MSPTEREVAASRFVTGDHQLLRNPFTSTAEFAALLQQLGGFWKDIILSFYRQDMPAAAQMLNLATVYRVTHVMCDLFVPFLDKGRDHFQELQEKGRKLLAQLRIMCSLINRGNTLPDDAFLHYTLLVNEYIEAHNQLTGWIEKQLVKLLQDLLLQSQKRIMAERMENVANVNFANLFMDAGKKQREIMEQWLIDHPLYF